MMTNTQIAALAHRAGFGEVADNQLRIEEFAKLKRFAEDVLALNAVPDAFGTREGEHPQYIEGWNDCRAEMLRGMKP